MSILLIRLLLLPPLAVGWFGGSFAREDIVFVAHLSISLVAKLLFHMPPGEAILL